MARFFLILALILGFGRALSAQTEPAADPAIAAVIQQQLDAFEADDFARAFSFASPTIKGLFGTPDNFGLMVKRGYPMVYRPGEVRFLDLREIGGVLWQKVLIRDAAGAFHTLDYQMVQGEGGWLIDAVRLLEAPQVGA